MLEKNKKDEYMTNKFFMPLLVSLVCSTAPLSAIAVDEDRLFASIKDSIPKRQHGQGQYDQLIIRGAYLIDGTGAPALSLIHI